MSLKLGRRARVGPALRSAVLREVDAAVTAAGGAADTPMSPEVRVHAVRSHLKRARALLRLGRAHPGRRRRVREDLAAIARLVAVVRDADVLPRALDALPGDPPDLIARLRVELAARAARVRAGGHVDLRLSDVAAALVRARAQVARWRWQESGWGALGPGVRRTYRRGRRVARALARDPARDPAHDGFHRWRKAVKEHLHHVTLLRGIAPRMMRARARKLDALAETLGAEHDLAMLAAAITAGQALADDARARRQVLALIAGRRVAIRAQALASGVPLYAHRPRRFERRLDRRWHRWRG